MRVDGESREPARAPEIARRLAFTRKQIIGIPLLAAIPIMSLFGWFGESQAAVQATSRSVAMSIRYPARFRYRQVQSLDIAIRNVSGRVIDTVDVSLDTAYVSRFSGVRIEPAPQVAFTVAITRLQPGESRLIAVEFSGDRYGRHLGRIGAVVHSDTAAVTVHTIVFP